jgi:Mn2+/Fe2+ NRAMP family transporter
MKSLSVFLAALMPGILVAATGVGAGDLLTAGIAGSALGVGILWAAWSGALTKYILNEGIARWQMATGTTLIEGWRSHLGPWVTWPFSAYLCLWAFFVGGALSGACGAAGAALFPWPQDPSQARAFWGIVHALVGFFIVRAGGFVWFERIMGICIGLMFVAVLTTAALLPPSPASFFEGLVFPAIPAGGGAWVIGVMGGVGGTVTLLSYGYWIREKGRHGADGVKACRRDLAAGYLLSALFGLAMIVIGSRVSIVRGPSVVPDLAQQLEMAIGWPGHWVFLLGFWGAVFSSLLGVWQSAPKLFADLVTPRSSNGSPDPIRARRHEFLFLTGITLVPLPLLWIALQRAQLIYAIVGAAFLPFLALTLLIMNNRRQWMGKGFGNGWLANTGLALTLIFFAAIGISEATQAIARLLRNF